MVVWTGVRLPAPPPKTTKPYCLVGFLHLLVQNICANLRRFAEFCATFCAINQDIRKVYRHYGAEYLKCVHRERDELRLFHCFSSFRCFPPSAPSYPFACPIPIPTRRARHTRTNRPRDLSSPALRACHPPSSLKFFKNSVDILANLRILQVEEASTAEIYRLAALRMVRMRVTRCQTKTPFIGVFFLS